MTYCILKSTYDMARCRTTWELAVPTVYRTIVEADEVAQSLNSLSQPWEYFRAQAIATVSPVIQRQLRKVAA